MEEVAIVILNFNGSGFLSKFLPTLIENTPSEVAIYVADNASTDNSVAFLQKSFPKINIINLPKNFGFAEGYNQALKKVNSKYYVLLNSDVEVTSNWLKPLIAQLQNPFIAACQPKILSYKYKDSFEYAGAAGGFIDNFGYPFCRGRILDHLEKDNGQYNDNCYIFWASGSCFAIKSEIYHQMGGFDGDFFAHMEEIDLCWRLQLAGYKIGYTYSSTVYHVGGGTLPKSNPYKTYLNFRNGLYMVFKNFPSKHFLFKIIIRMLIDGLAALNYFAKGEFGNFGSIFKAHMHFYVNLPLLIKKRKACQSLPNANNKLATISSKSLVFEYLKNSKLKFVDLGTEVKKN